MVTLIAKSTSLTKDQVEEVFSTYRKIIEQLINSNVAQDNNIAIIMPFIGKFRFQLRKGHKAGEEVKIPMGFSEKWRTEILKEDEPDFYRLFFDIKNGLQNYIKEQSREKFKNKNRG